MRPTRRYSRLMEDRNSVADQPGGALFFSGIVLALVLGLTIRGFFNPAKIKALVEQAASRIHPDIQVQIESAHLSLSRGYLLPRLAVVIEQVHMESETACWMAPRMDVDEIQLPISVLSWLSGKSPLTRVVAGKVTLRLTKDRPKSCEGLAVPEGSVPSASTAAGGKEPSAAVSLVRKTGTKPESLKASGEIESLEIERLVLESEFEPRHRLELDEFDFRVKSTRPRVFQVKAKSQFLREAGATDWMTPSNIHVEYKEFPEKILEARIFGNWREGYYSVAAAVRPDEDDLKMNAELRHLPLSQVLGALSKAGVQTGRFSPRQSWLSLRAEAQGSLARAREVPVEARNLRLEGDLGEMSVEHLRIKSLQPLKTEPFHVDIRSLDLDRLLQFLQQEHPTPVLAQLGRLKGVAEIRDPENFRLSGEHSGLQFIFSNKGQREIQAISNIRGEISRTAGQWQFTLPGVELDQGVFTGDLKMEATPDFKNVDIRWRAEDLALAPGVQKLMTRGGEISPLKAQMQFKFLEGRLVKWKGQVRLPRLRIEGTTIQRLAIGFDEKDGMFLLNPQMESLEIESGSPAGQILQTAVPSTWFEQNRLVLKSVDGQFQFRQPQEMKWHQLTARVEKSAAVLQSQGEWLNDGRLQGDLQLRAKDMKRHWKIRGHRDQPTLEMVP